MKKPKTAAEAMDMIFRRGSTTSANKNKKPAKQADFKVAPKDCGCGNVTTKNKSNE